ncbi:MAG: DUF732 domain-containing protein [Leptolyngbya sp. BL-A-14]
MKFVPVAIAALSASLLYYSPAFSKEANFPCYSVSSDGKVRNLTDSVCHHGERLQLKAALEARDAAFLRDFNQQTEGKLTIPLSGTELIKMAQKYCASRREGQLPADVRNAQLRQVSADDPEVEANQSTAIGVVHGIAAKYYCPGLLK